MNRPPWVCDPCPQANGLPQTQPRATPWETTPKPHFALKGPNHSADRLARPFRADATNDTPSPGRCPGLGLVTPFGRPGS